MNKRQYVSKNVKSDEELLKNDSVFEVDGKVFEVLPEGKFRVKVLVEGKEYVLMCYQSGKMRQNYIRLVLGDRVKLEVSKYDVTKGRIIYRY